MADKQKIKLVQIIAESDLSGGPKHVLDLLTHIDKNEFDCFLICPNGNLSREVRDTGRIEIINIPMNSKYDLPAIFLINKELNRIQSEHDPFGTMIVHTHGTRAGLLGRLAIPKGVFSVYTEHRWDNDFHLENRITEWIQLIWLKKLNRKTNMIIAVSNSVKRFLVERKLAPENRIEVIHNGISFARNKMQETITKHKRNGNHHIIGNVGNLNHQKGQVYLIEAMPAIIEHYPHAMLEIIGEGEERKNLELKIKELKLGRHVTLLGRQLNPGSFMEKWDVFVSSSVAETFGIVILEAFVHKLPVIATKVGGIPDIITDDKDGILVGSRNPKKISDAVIELLSDTIKCEKLSLAGYERAKDFDWKKIVDQIEKAYIKLI